MTVQAFCPNCGASRVVSSRFCASCGRAFDGDAPISAPPPPAGVVRDLNWTVILALAGAGLLAIGAFLPWITATIPLAGNIARSGMEGGDGWLVLVLALVPASFGYQVWAGKAGRRSWLTPMVVGFLGIGFYLLELQNIQQRIASVDTTYRQLVTVGVGLHVVLLGALATLVAGLRQRSAETASASRLAPMSMPVLSRLNRFQQLPAPMRLFWVVIGFVVVIGLILVIQALT